jgi:hypothetical protein
LSGKTFSVSTADTWEYKTLTFSGDTANAITNGSGIGLQVHWWLQAGSSYTTGALNSGWDTAALGDYAAGLTATIGDSTSDYFQITGVQLEVGDTATPFEHRSYGDELARCQRYYYSSDEADSYMVAFDVTNGQGYYGTIMLQPTMRTGPTITLSNESLSNFDGLNIFRNYPTRFGWYDTATGSGRGLWQFEWVADAEL